MSHPKISAQLVKWFKTYSQQAEVQQCLAQHIVARLSLDCDYLVVILWLGLWLAYG